jgi:hypothetical protein
MKTISRILIILFVVLTPVLTVAAAENNEQLIVTPFSGSETVTGIPNPPQGTFKTVDGITIMQGWVFYAVDTASDPRVSGKVTVTVSGVTKGDPFTGGTGSVHGTERISNANGGWNLQFTGKNLGGNHVIIHIWGVGEGAYAGMRGVWDAESWTGGLTATYTGYIVEHAPK